MISFKLLTHIFYFKRKYIVYKNSYYIMHQLNYFLTLIFKIIVRHTWISLMELRHLRYFITVAEELSFNKSCIGEKLHTAAFFKSTNQKDLEDDIGVQLFYRNKQRTQLKKVVFFRASTINPNPKLTRQLPWSNQGSCCG